MSINTYKTKGTILISLFLLVIGCIIAFYTRSRTTSETYNRAMPIGAILPMTGVSSDLGTTILTAMKIAEVNVNKKSDVKIKLLIEDGKSSAQGTIAAYQKLLIDRPSAFVVFGDIPCYNLAPLAQKNKIPVITYGAAAGNIVSLSDYYYRGWTPMSATAKKMAQFAIKRLNKIDGAIIYMNNNLGNESNNAITDEYTKNGGRIHARETFNVTSKDVRAQIQKVLSKKPHIIFVIGFGQGYITVLNQLQEAGYKGSIITDETVTIPEYLKSIRNSATGVYFCCTQFDPSTAAKEYSESFILPYKKQMGVEPNVFAAFGYLCIDLLAKAQAQAGTQPKNIDLGLKNIHNYMSIMGEVSYDTIGEIRLPLSIKQIQQNYKFITLE